MLSEYFLQISDDEADKLLARLTSRWFRALLFLEIADLSLLMADGGHVRGIRYRVGFAGPRRVCASDEWMDAHFPPL